MTLDEAVEEYLRAGKDDHVATAFRRGWELARQSSASKWMDCARCGSPVHRNKSRTGLGIVGPAVVPHGTQCGGADSPKGAIPSALMCEGCDDSMWNWWTEGSP